MKVFYTGIDYIRVLMVLTCLLAAIGLGVLLYPSFSNETAIPVQQEIKDSLEIPSERESKLQPPIPH